jgi:hypothetical protein
MLTLDLVVVDEGASPTWDTFTWSEDCGCVETPTATTASISDDDECDGFDFLTAIIWDGSRPSGSPGPKHSGHSKPKHPSLYNFNPKSKPTLPPPPKYPSHTQSSIQPSPSSSSSGKFHLSFTANSKTYDLANSAAIVLVVSETNQTKFTLSNGNLIEESSQTIYVDSLAVRSNSSALYIGDPSSNSRRIRRQHSDHTQFFYASDQLVMAFEFGEPMFLLCSDAVIRVGLSTPSYCQQLYLILDFVDAAETTTNVS